LGVGEFFHRCVVIGHIAGEKQHVKHSWPGRDKILTCCGASSGGFP
jgi:hypothetical protein